MIKLIKNEIYKIFNKKTTYILLGIIVLYSVFISIIYKNNSTSDYYPNQDSHNIGFCIETLKYDEKDPYCNAIMDTNNELNKYSKDSWQANVINNKYYDIAYNYYNNLTFNNKELEQTYINTKNALQNNDWKYFVNLEINDIKEEIKQLEEYASIGELKDENLLDNKARLFSLNEHLKTLQYRLDNDLAYGNDYLNNAIETINNTSYDVAVYEMKDKNNNNSSDLESIQEFYKSKYILETKNDINNEQTLKTLFTNFFDIYSFLIILFVIMIAGGIVSEEFNKGTIKSLLITPHKRTTILLSKFITILLMIFLVVIFTSLVQFIAGSIIFGISSLKIPVVYYNLTTKSLEIINILKYLLIKFVVILPKIILLATLAFAISVIVKNTAFAVIIPLCGMMGSELINLFALQFKLKYLYYFVTTNWDFNYYIFGNTSPYGLSFMHSIIVCLIYFLIMIIISFIIFKKTDIKNI